MLFRLTAKIESDATPKHPLQKRVSASARGFKVVLHFKHGKLDHLTLERRLRHDEAFKHITNLLTAKKIKDMNSYVLVDEAKSLLRYVESLGSIWFSIRSIDMANVDIAWVPQNLLERWRYASIATNLRLSLGWTKFSMVADEKNLKYILDNETSLGPAVTPLAFYREGINEYSKERFGNAFINFFFVIEGLYGGGKSGEKQLINELKKSSHLVGVIKDCIKSDRYRKVDNDDLEYWFKHYNTNRTAEGAITMIVKCRGDLHHYRVRSSRKQGTPLNQTEYIALAHFLQIVCMNIYAKIHEDLTGSRLDMALVATKKVP